MAFDAPESLGEHSRIAGKEDVELEKILHTQGEQAYQKRRDELEVKSWKQIEQERRQVAEAHRIVEAARRNEQEWSSAKQKVFYERLRAEAEAKAKADAEDLAAMRAAAMAARKSPESAPADEEAKAVNEPTEKSGT
jgi:membrane protein involved in colicin uptake